MKRVRPAARPLVALVCALVAGATIACGSEPKRTVQKPHVFDERGVHVIAHEPGACDACDLYRLARGYVVRLDSTSGIGAGVVLSDDGLIATNARVVGKADAVEVSSLGNTWVGRVLVKDPDLDLALVRLPPSGVAWSPPPLDGDPPPPKGSEVYLLGHPVGLGWCITRGTITGYGRDRDARTLIHTSAPVSPGNSGGALVDAKGRLIGIVISRPLGDFPSNVAFARPSADVLAFLEASGQRR